MSRDSNVSKGLLIGFFSGAIVGAAVALLYAPKSGKELRQDIKDRAEDWKEDADKFMNTAKEKAQIAFNEGKHKAEELVSEAKVKAGEIMKDANRVVSEAKSKVVDEASKIKTGLQAGVDAYKDAKNS